MSGIEKLLITVAKLREPETGCPWDIEQTHQSITDCLIDECCELLQTIDRLDMDHMEEELGDVLLQVIFHAQIAKENGHFDFDSVLMPYNWVTSHHVTYSKDFEKTLKLCNEREIAVQTIKSLARGPWAAGISKRRATWYEPLEADEDIRTAVNFVLARPGIFLNSVGDVGLLPSLLRAASERIELPDQNIMEAHSQRTGLSSIFGI